MIEPLEPRFHLAATLVKDINTFPSTDFAPQYLTTIGSNTYFTWSDGIKGFELWRTNGLGNGTTMVADIHPGAAGSFPRSLTNVNGTLYFSADDGSGFELWKSDGTALGTTRVADINPGIAGSFPDYMVGVGSTVYFYATNGVHGRELWKSNGTAAGTMMVRDVWAGPTGQSVVSAPAALPGGIVLFRAATGSAATGLWRTDGTEANTSLVKSTSFSSGLSGPRQLLSSGSVVYMTDIGGYLWRSDGTDAGTVKVQDSNTVVTEMLDIGGVLYVARAHGLFKVAVGASSAASVTVSGQSVSNPSSLSNIGNTLYFTGSQSSTGLELYSSNTSGVSASLVKDIVSGSTSSSPAEMTNVQNTMYFRVRNATGAYEMWKSNGTAIGTTLVAAIPNRGLTSLPPMDFTALGSDLLFVTDDNTAGAEIWRANAGGLAMVADVYPGTQSSISFGRPVTALGKIFILADDGVNGTELWTSDGTSSGTAKLLEIQPGASDSFHSGLVAAGNRVYFWGWTNATGSEPWVSDGTAAGTVPLANIATGATSSSPSEFRFANGWVFFSAENASSGEELWRTDGTPGGTSMVKDIHPNALDSRPAELTEMGGILYFIAQDSTTGRELWRSDGSDAGTYRVKDIFSGSPDSSITGMQAVDGRLYFSATNGSDGAELWTSDGTEGGTFQVKNINPGSSSSTPRWYASLGGLVYFAATTSAEGTELWQTDGTSAGTRLVVDILPGSGSSAPGVLVVMHDHIYFSASDGSRGTELWRSRGTAATTSLVKDINPLGDGPFISNGFPPLVSGGRLFFNADHPSTGYEYWTSDGTTEGTFLVTDLMGGYPGAIAYAFEFGGNIYIDGHDAIHGFELFRVNDSFAPYVWGASYDYEAGNIVSFRLSEPLSIVPTPGSVSIQKFGGGSVSPLGFTYDGLTRTVILTMPSGLSEGNYRVTMAGGTVSDTAGNVLVSPYVFDFFVLPGDANYDRAVDARDLYILATNWLGTGKTYSQGDFDRNGTVNAADLTILAQRWQARVDVPVAAEPLPTSPSRRTPVRTPSRAIELVM